MKFKKILSLIAVGSVLHGCAIPVAVVAGGAATAGYMSVQERGAKSAFFDTKLKTHIKERLTSRHYKYLTNIGTSVLEGEVLLTGVVPSMSAKNEVIQTVRNTPKVKRVYDELIIGKYNSSYYAKDAAISFQIAGRMANAADIFAINYEKEVVKGEVYIIGIATSQAEMERVLHVARTTKGVKRVHNYVRLTQIKDQRVQQTPAPAQPESR